MEKIINIYIWQNDIYTGEVFTLSDMPDDKYQVKENTVNLSKLIMNSLPGNTLDLLLQYMADEIKPIIEQGKHDLLLEPYDLTNRLRAGINKLASNSQ